MQLMKLQIVYIYNENEEFNKQKYSVLNKKWRDKKKNEVLNRKIMSSIEKQRVQQKNEVLNKKWRVKQKNEVLNRKIESSIEK